MRTRTKIKLTLGILISVIGTVLMILSFFVSCEHHGHSFLQKKENITDISFVIVKTDWRYRNEIGKANWIKPDEIQVIRTIPDNQFDRVLEDFESMSYYYYNNDPDFVADGECLMITYKDGSFELFCDSAYSCHRADGKDMPCASTYHNVEDFHRFFTKYAYPSEDG